MIDDVVVSREHKYSRLINSSSSINLFLIIVVDVVMLCEDDCTIRTTVRTIRTVRMVVVHVLNVQEDFQ